MNEAHFEGVQNLVLSELLIYDFSVDFLDFEALICTSKNALLALEKNKIKLNLNLPLFVVGEKTAEFARKIGFKNVNFPRNSYASELVTEFLQALRGKKCLYLRGKKVSSNLGEILGQKGVKIKEIIVYEKLFKARKFELLRPGIFIFTSPLSVREFLKYNQLFQNDKIIAIGEKTAAVLRAFGEVFVSEKQSVKSCVELARALKK